MEISIVGWFFSLHFSTLQMTKTNTDQIQIVARWAVNFIRTGCCFLVSGRCTFCRFYVLNTCVYFGILFTNFLELWRWFSFRIYDYYFVFWFTSCFSFVRGDDSYLEKFSNFLAPFLSGNGFHLFLLLLFCYFEPYRPIPLATFLYNLFSLRFILYLYSTISCLVAAISWLNL